MHIFDIVTVNRLLRRVICVLGAELIAYQIRTDALLNNVRKTIVILSKYTTRRKKRRQERSSRTFVNHLLF